MTDLDAGDALSWRAATAAALRDRTDAVVPCGSCTACCRSAQYVHVDPDEVDAIAAIPRELLFPAPRMPRGHKVLVFDERGHCPMLVDDACSIYSHRPRTCRQYDCRVFAATGVDPPEGSPVAVQVRRWRFRGDDPAPRAAATFLARHRDALGERVPRSPTQLAVLAVEIAELFDRDEPDVGVVARTIDAIRPPATHV